MSVDTSNATAAAGVDPTRLRVAGAIKQAAASSGMSFQYLLTTAKMESDFNPSAGASTSSAHGLFQFIDQTWLATVKEAGAQLGYGNLADQISRSSDGSYSVPDAAARKSIMKLRDDPTVASAMAAALTQSNSFKLTGMIGRRPSDSELYMAHFMGVGGAAKLIGNAEDNPQASAARLFPNAAAANRSIFYDRASGRARSVSEVYSVLQQRYASAASSQATQSAMASVGGDIKPAIALASATPGIAAPTVDTATYLSTFPDTRSVASVASVAPAAQAVPVTMASASTTSADTAPASPVFRSLFQDGVRAQPVSQTVRELWGNSASLTSDPPASSGPAPSTAAVAALAPAKSGGGLDLFSDRSGTFSG
ncbi:MAG TPA: transglycosylase SLT domain-containing protein [Bradyrhizobium sp.]|uniref:transglycosylase SLT domain-containing protein n=1 Tax=Bradyrhizobium sp. TaxID=376 RepID=UPI002D80573C|nr:transglycosylase SLT domain-containing protein [Bradyrhizobium sp.]HET7887780.1 transglycosylase SLT domain-containing protein [Bradyrhizobium sp.]